MPSLDLRAGRCVRLLRGDFDQETIYPLEAHELLQRYRDMGASWMHIVDLDGARSAQLENRETIARLASQQAVQIQVGGGVRDLRTADDLLRIGVDRVVIGSLAAEKPDTVIDWIGRFGGERVCLAFDIELDADGCPQLRTRGWTQSGGLSLWQALEFYRDCGLKHVLCTDIARDGALSGPNTALYSQAITRHPELAWQASGGIASGADLAALAAAGAAAAISGKALLEERISLMELRPYLPNA
ncbi:MAG: 1-(5-phosphoribosyl)-5-[(5-phosphoribosylamino)methylideneamino] imidazole-4-carboxamide isomerase [Steroidobacteraceae bacterium]